MSSILRVAGYHVYDCDSRAKQLMNTSAAIKQSLYDSGATYAAMSGSGSAMFALYRK